MTHPVLGFARPTGPYGIGTTTYHMVDGDRSEVFASNPDARRELMVQVWYPARTHGSPRAPYLPDARMHADVVRDGLSQPTMFITRDADSMRLERRRGGGWPETDIDETLGTRPSGEPSRRPRAAVIPPRRAFARADGGAPPAPAR